MEPLPQPVALPPERPWQISLRGLFLVLTVAACGACLLRWFGPILWPVLLGPALFPAYIGAVAAGLVHLLSRSISNREQRRGIILGGYTLSAWLTASILLKYLSLTDRVIAAGGIPVMVLLIWGIGWGARGGNGGQRTENGKGRGDAE